MSDTAPGSHDHFTVEASDEREGFPLRFTCGCGFNLPLMSPDLAGEVWTMHRFDRDLLPIVDDAWWRNRSEWLREKLPVADDDSFDEQVERISVALWFLHTPYVLAFPTPLDRSLDELIPAVRSLSKAQMAP